MSTADSPYPGVELEKLLLVIHAGLRVRLRHHFFNWTQGSLQTLLPHDLLVCGVADRQSERYRFDSFSCDPQPAPRIEALTRRDGGIMQRLVQTWEKNSGDPLLFDPHCAAGPVAVLSAEIAGHQLGSLVAHGTRGGSGIAATFFCFCCMRGASSPQHAFIVELLVPYLHAAWMRVQYQERVPVARHSHPLTLPQPGESGSPLTARELEILRWVGAGKSNMDIGTILGISGLTVKNHVQNILRKLKVLNRTQAVTKCMSLNLLQSDLRNVTRNSQKSFAPKARAGTIE